MTGIPVHELQQPPPEPLSNDFEKAHREILLRIKQRNIRTIALFNRLAAILFAAIRTAERQIAVIQDLHTIFLTSFLKTRDHEQRYPLHQNTFCKDVALIPILLEYSEQAWPNSLQSIDEAIRERKSFIKEIKELVRISDSKGKIV